MTSKSLIYFVKLFLDKTMPGSLKPVSDCVSIFRYKTYVEIGKNFIFFCKSIGDLLQSSN